MTTSDELEFLVKQMETLAKRGRDLREEIAQAAFHLEDLKHEAEIVAEGWGAYRKRADQLVKGD